MADALLAALATRAAPGIALGVSVGAFAWAVGWSRRRAAVALATGVAVVLVAGGWNPALLMTIALLLAAGGARIVSGVALRLREVAALGAIPVIAALGLQRVETAAYWQGAFSAAVATGCGLTLAGAIDRRLDRPATASPASGAGLTAFAVSAGSVALGSYLLDLAGPGDGGAVLLAATAAAAAHAGSAAGRIVPWVRVLAATAFAAVTAAALVAFLP